MTFNPSCAATVVVAPVRSVICKVAIAISPWMVRRVAPRERLGVAQVGPDDVGDAIPACDRVGLVMMNQAPDMGTALVQLGRHVAAEVAASSYSRPFAGMTKGNG